MPEKNKLYTAEITGLTSEGSGVCRIDEMAVFVPETAVGDTIEVKIVKVLSHYAYGIVSRIITPSPDREERTCEAYKKCGGCVFRHISYEAECRAKNDVVMNAFARIGGLSPEYDDFIYADSSDRYRNKAQYPLAVVDDKAVCGFFAPRSHRVVPVVDCPLQPIVFSRILEIVLDYVNTNKIPVYDEISGKGILRHIYIRMGSNSGEIMMCIVAKSNIARKLHSLCRELTDIFPEIKSIVLNINSDKTNVILGSECIVLCGKPDITDIMCGNKVNISPLSFYQINTAQAERLYRKALEYANPSKSDVIADLYCGAGTIGLSMAQFARKIIGIEIIPEAVKNAKQNAAANNIKNAEFYCGDSGEVFARLNISPDIIIIDPPRKGCSEDTLKTIISAKPRKIVMISCNPSTAARDAKFLSENNYSADKVCGVDLFPCTKHVECVVLLTRNNC